MDHGELVVLFLLIAVAVLTAIARLLDVPYPILLVLGGSLVGYAPGFRTSSSSRIWWSWSGTSTRSRVRVPDARWPAT